MKELHEKCFAPWTDEQVKMLIRRQANENLHEYTCLHGHELTPINEGWYCKICHYVQNWCHKMDVTAIVPKTKETDGTTKVICAYTSCTHNEVEGQLYICKLATISISFYSNSDDVGFKMRCDMKTTRPDYAEDKDG